MPSSKSYNQMPDFSYVLEELGQITPPGCNGTELLQGLIGIIDRNLRPLSDRKAQNARSAEIIARYCRSLQKRVPPKRPRTQPGVFKSVEAFVTKDIRLAAREYAEFEANAEKLLMSNVAMHLTDRGVANHAQRALNVIDRFMLTVAQQWEQLGQFKNRLQTLEHQFYDRDNWALHLHDRLNRLANLITATDSALTTLKRALINKRPHEKAVEALRALRDNSLNPLEFIGKVFADVDGTCAIQVHAPEPPLSYANHFLVREIILELVHNAISNGATLITLSAVRGKANTARIEVLDNCPGGIPSDMLPRLGKDQITRTHAPLDEIDLYNDCRPQRGWGLYTVCNNLIPNLGPKASIAFQSPIAPRGGTRIVLTAPIVEKTIMTRKRTATNRAPTCGTFIGMDAIAAGGIAFSTARMSARIPLPLHQRHAP